MTSVRSPFPTMDRSVALPQVLGAPVASNAERRADGRARRKITARSEHGAWEPPTDRRDPIDIVNEVGVQRIPELVPVRNRRMLESAFTFFRGSALQMSLDLASTPSSGIDVQLCGDAHLMNFGVFASPERSLMFDLNDFDETWPGPFEWDLKRLAASAVIAARDLGMTKAEQTVAAVSAAASYRGWVTRYAEMTHLDVWYAKLEAQSLLDLMAPSDRRSTKRVIDKAMVRDHLAALNRLTRFADGRHRIVADPPLVVRADEDPAVTNQLPVMIEEYRANLQADRRALFDRYRVVDMARKAVGVGSVGTRCWILLFQGPNGGPLFLQAKEAVVSGPQAAGLPGPEIHQGQRVVEGQRQLQTASDVLLGWTTAPTEGRPYYLRQLWDAKGSADLTGMTPAALATYAGACGWALARAHARTGDSSAIAGYIGVNNRFDLAMATFGHAYADQTERDFAALRRAADHGLVPVSPA
jgi:uncharacterized protein (DUF2252 family)